MITLASGRWTVSRAAVISNYLVISDHSYHSACFSRWAEPSDLPSCFSDHSYHSACFFQMSWAIRPPLMLQWPQLPFCLFFSRWAEPSDLPPCFSDHSYHSACISRWAEPSDLPSCFSDHSYHSACISRWAEPSDLPPCGSDLRPGHNGWLPAGSGPQCQPAGPPEPGPTAPGCYQRQCGHHHGASWQWCLSELVRPIRYDTSAYGMWARWHCHGEVAPEPRQCGECPGWLPDDASALCQFVWETGDCASSAAETSKRMGFGWYASE